VIFGDQDSLTSSLTW